TITTTPFNPPTTPASPTPTRTYHSACMIELVDSVQPPPDSFRVLQTHPSLLTPPSFSGCKYISPVKIRTPCDPLLFSPFDFKSLVCSHTCFIPLVYRSNALYCFVLFCAKR